MKEQLEHYELVLIIPGSISEDQHARIVAEVKDLLKSKEAVITSEQDLGRKKLAYAISNLRYGFYFALEFDLLARHLKTIEADLKLNKEILRYLIIRKQQKTEEQINKEEKIKSGRIKAELQKQQEEAKEVKKEKADKSKISLEDLDKKLDEILDEKVI